MKKSLKFASLVLAVSMVAASLSGCGAGASSSDTFKIGGIGPITGGAAIYGQAVMNGAQIAVDEINAAGGINGYKIEFSFEDDEHNPEKSVNAYNTLLDKKMQVLVGTVTSAPCIAVVDKAKADNVFMLTPSATATEAIAQDNAFRVCFSDPNQGTEAAKYIGAKNLATKVAIIFDNSDPYSSGIKDNFVKESANQNFEVVAQEAYTQDSNTDFSTQLQATVDSGADLLFLPIYYQDASNILAQAAQKDIDIAVFGCDGFDGILGLDGFDTSLAEGVLLLTPFSTSSTDEKTQAFVKAYEAKCNGLTPNQFAADAYDAVYIVKAAIEKANITPAASNAEICDALKKAMTEISYTGLTGSDITWGADGEPNKAPIVVEIKNGEYVVLD
ncbi:MAG: ABC transporter substrate-binding protein [Lachnospiraceae bacterium]|nr:ABC transporter substrate-binding protein [Lachnospiraceae bacterium]